ncbi:PqqD family peptide modification chaperone [Nitrosospira sp. Nsp1]|uniref:PqqD family peptide modification chaperone n=1 Tax=Nitrosospira sp. Nsp1 TaxID=136547 RepID=UPI00088C5723|nr:PqqD family peptide modification chaperone [Nitrosospira sp. Nsp1]SCX42378.1 putative peptide zinc metalloprotease protein [Nitrosospira sp. Nsp1]
MAGSSLSSSWYRVAGLKPILRAHAKVHRQRFRGQAWYVLQDSATGRMHRFSPGAYYAMSLMDGKHTVEEIWVLVAKELDEAAPSQDDMIQLLTQLHMADILQSNVPPDLLELSQRRVKQRRSKWMKNFLNPMSIRFPLWDPDRFINLTYPYLKWLFTWRGGVLWLVVVTPALIMAASHWNDLTQNLSDRVLSSSNLLALWLAFPIVKLLHELGHAYTTKAGGGEVHEMGIMLLVLMPVPYVDATAATAFRSKRHRAMVGAAGMMVELFLAALAIYVWLVVEHGVIHALAFNVIFVAGLSTIVFNGNPLLRFDGYYILSDLIEIPNLGSRANQYLGYLVQRYAFGKQDARQATETKGERLWLAFYAVASFIYRLFVTFAIIVFIVGELFFIGVILALWSLASMLVIPVVKGIHHVFYSPALHRQRRRAVNVTVGCTTFIVLFSLVVPMPFHRQAEGVIWVPEDAEIRAHTAGFVHRLVVNSGTQVNKGDIVIESDDPDLFMQLVSQRARVEQLEVEYSSAFLDDRLQAAIAHDELKKERAFLARVENRIEGLAVEARTSGRLVVPRAIDLPGKFMQQGELMGYVLEGPIRTVRVVLTQDDIDVVRGGLRSVQLKLIDRLSDTYAANVLREVPGGRDQLPSKALALEHGGIHATDPRDRNGTQTLVRVFQFDLLLPSSVGDVSLGARAHVRFDLAPEPFAFRWYRAARQLLLSNFNV